MYNSDIRKNVERKQHVTPLPLPWSPSLLKGNSSKI
jgi:hypothetical protein